MRAAPASTYRLQLSADFDLDHAADVVAYLRALGVDWVYVSPVLAAEPGSTHGYDVVDHRHIDSSRGGRAGFHRFAAAVHAARMGVLVDIVPNHVGIATPIENHWWWDVLQHGPDSVHADSFDIDWEYGGGKVRIPVLGDDIDALQVIDGQLRYHQHRFPLSSATPPTGTIDEVLAAQHYELVNWRRADAELNYRRFFAVNTLAAIRVEDPGVFAASHGEIRRWFDDGLADGLRVDHPDGLRDPGRYLGALHSLTGGAYTVVEKILEGEERLVSSWPVEGTTGYDFLGNVDRLLVDGSGEAGLRTAFDARCEGRVEWRDLIHATKRGVADGILRSEVLRIVREIARDEPAPAEAVVLADVVAELLACFPVYRSYLPIGSEHLDAAAGAAARRRPDLADVIEPVRAVLAAAGHPASLRFQQTSGMVMAKGVEDCAFYRYNALGSLTEVGGDPSEFSIDVSEFHRRQEQRQARSPSSMTTLSTHDTKRSEDVRARLNVLSEVTEEWEAFLTRLERANPLSDQALAVLLWQAVIGAWPLPADRAHAYAEKAAREAGASTSWSRPNEVFESELHRFVDRIFDDPDVTTKVAAFVARIEVAGWSNSLSAKLIQLTSPGVPDVYQGSELWDTSLVDPDNRRMVDFGMRASSLALLDESAPPSIDRSGLAKLWITSRALRLRRDNPELFTRYTSVEVYGAAAAHAIAFDRGGAVTVATRLPIGLARRGGWEDTGIEVRPGRYRDVMTGRSVEGTAIMLGALLDSYPVALLARESP